MNKPDIETIRRIGAHTILPGTSLDIVPAVVRANGGVWRSPLGSFLKAVGYERACPGAVDAITWKLRRLGLRCRAEKRPPFLSKFDMLLIYQDDWWNRQLIEQG